MRIVMVDPVPTLSQYRAYRAERRMAVRRITKCIKGGVINLTPWSSDVIRRSRNEHTASIARQAHYGIMDGERLPPHSLSSGLRTAQ